MPSKSLIPRDLRVRNLHPKGKHWHILGRRRDEAKSSQVKRPTRRWGKERSGNHHQYGHIWRKILYFIGGLGTTKHDKKTTHKSPQSQYKYVQSSGYGNIYTSWVTWGSFCLVNHKINECSSCVCCIWWCLGTNVHFFFFHFLRANKLSPTTSFPWASPVSLPWNLIPFVLSAAFRKVSFGYY